MSKKAAYRGQVRADRIPGIPQPYEYHPCLWCGAPSGMNGLHLLQCSNMPANLAAEREQLRQQLNQKLVGEGIISTSELAAYVVRCCGSTEVTRQGLLFFRKISKAVKQPTTTITTTIALQQNVWDRLDQLFSADDEALPELQVAVSNDSLPA